MAPLRGSYSPNALAGYQNVTATRFLLKPRYEPSPKLTVNKSVRRAGSALAFSAPLEVKNISVLCLPKFANLFHCRAFQSKFFMVQTTEQVDVIIYRVRENGLEVFFPNQESEGSLSAPFGDETEPERFAARYIELDPVADANGDTRKAIAIEADWHEIPSLRALVYEDFRVAKEKARLHIKHLVVDFEKGTYVAVKEAFKRVLPQQYAFLKELKEIIADKNQAKSI